MVEAIIWIGVVLSGVATLGIVEFIRSNAVIKAHSEGIKTGLMAAVLILLTLIAATVATLFFFVVFLAAVWQYALIAGGVFAVIFLWLIRQDEAPPGVLSVQPERAEPMQVATAAEPARGTTTGLFLRVAAFAVQATGAAAILVLLVLLAFVVVAAYFAFMYLDFLMGAMSVAWPYLLVFAAIFLAYYLISHHRSPPSS